jgi:hypothetical protein
MDDGSLDIVIFYGNTMCYFFVNLLLMRHFYLNFLAPAGRWRGN